jgi:hypothetical protein
MSICRLHPIFNGNTGELDFPSGSILISDVDLIYRVQSNKGFSFKLTVIHFGLKFDLKPVLS